MGHMGGKKHLKRLSAPKTWKILRKEYKFTVKPRPGPHSIEDSVPLLILLRDILEVAKNRKEAKYILNQGFVEVDGRVIKDEKFPVGFMDAIKIKDKTYRIVFDDKGRLTLIEDDKPNLKLCRIKRKVKIKGGKTQLGLHDGRSIIVDSDEYKVGDSLLIEVPSQKIIKHIKLEPGKLIYVFRGKHTGTIGKLKEVIPGSLTSPAKLVITLDDGSELTTIKDYGFVIGEKESEIKVRV